MEKYINKIIHGDSGVVLPQIPGATVDLIVTDPPYYSAKRELQEKNFPSFDSYLIWYRKWIEEAWRILKPNGSLYVFILPLEFAETHLVIRECFCQKQIISWIKRNVMIKQSTTRNYFPKTEFVGFYTKNPKDYTWNSLAKEYGLQKACNFAIEPIIYGRTKEGTIHPTQKPLRLVAKFIYASSNEGDIVLDPFCGSGTTCVAAKMLNRKFVGIELESEYCKISRGRVGQFSTKDLKNKPRNAIF